ncbi:hypothetical protein [Streptomyces sp. 8N616]|uniref:hypothetical protein n=1 Tax=Streptomyces sp. 8N616 TaxID=3457414 RepID=UPI003FD67E9F
MTHRPGSDGDPARPRRGSGFGLLTPEDWYRIPLQPPERREASVRALIDRQFKGVDDQPILRRESEELLRGAAEAGADKGGVVLYLSFMDVSGVPLSASLLVSVVKERFRALDTVAALAREGQGEVEPVKLPAAGAAARRRRTERSRESKRLGTEFADTVVEYFVPVPGRDETLMLTFSTPLEPIADAMAELFDAVAGTLRWPNHDHNHNDNDNENENGETAWARS